MFIQDVKNVNVFVATGVGKPCSENIFRLMRLPLIRQIRAGSEPVWTR